VFFPLIIKIKKMIAQILNKFAPLLEKHGVKLSAVEAPAEVATEETKVEMMVEGALADGTYIASPAPEWAEGVEIFVMDADGNAQPLADGEYQLDNGKMIVVSEGKIASISEMEVEEEVKIEVEAEVTEQSVEETYSKDQVEALLNNVISEFSTKLSAVEEKLAVAEAKVVELSQAPAVAPVKQRAAVKTEQPIQLNQIQNTAERARAIVAKYTK
jgi:uncharacterized protein YejL (UPF0352 family)